jgi:hypothetical protein
MSNTTNTTTASASAPAPAAAVESESSTGAPVVKRELLTQSYLEQARHIWPGRGQHILAQASWQLHSSIFRNVLTSVQV